MPRTLFVFCTLGALLVACGTSVDSFERQATAAQRAPILGGTTDDARTNVVAIFREPAGASNAIFCSGSLIGPNLVLTAAHCAADIVSAGTGTACEDTDGRKADHTGTAGDPSRFSVVTTTDAYDTTAKAYAVTSVLTVPNASELPNCGNDIALLVLAEPIVSVTPFAPALDTPPTQGAVFTGAGYGYDGAVDTDGTRRSRDGLVVTSVGELRESAKLRATANDFIADIGPCGGDSGSPAIDAQNRVFGVMSRGQPTVCKSMLYTRIDPFADWIRASARDAAKVGGYDTPAWAIAQVDGGSDGSTPAPAGDSSSCVSGGAHAPSDASTPVVFGFVGLALVLERRRARSIKPSRA
ncbi:hypothetical protein BH09MYX1_BH09MYX1_50490 [soil metagenome]